MSAVNSELAPLSMCVEHPVSPLVPITKPTTDAVSDTG